MDKWSMRWSVCMTCPTLSSTYILVRELPPPTPRGAYLPWRPEYVQQEGGMEGQVDSAPSWLKGLQDIAGV